MYGEWFMPMTQHFGDGGRRIRTSGHPFLHGENSLDYRGTFLRKKPNNIDWKTKHRIARHLWS